MRCVPAPNTVGFLAKCGFGRSKCRVLLTELRGFRPGIALSRLVFGEFRLENCVSRLEIHKFRLEFPFSRLEIDKFRLEVGEFRLEIGNSRLEVGKFRVEFMKFQSPLFERLRHSRASR